MKLGFDIDGIVANMAQAMIDFANDKYGFDYTVELFGDFDITKAQYTDDHKRNEQIGRDVLDHVVYVEDAVASLKPYDEGVEALKKLKKYGHTLHFITSRPMSQRRITVEWFRDNKVPFNTIDVVGQTPKGMIGRTLNLDFYMDDKVKHLESMYKYKNRWRKGLAVFTRPWNINEPVDSTKFVRLSSWFDVVRHLGIHNR